MENNQNEQKKEVNKIIDYAENLLLEKKKALKKLNICLLKKV